MRPREPMNRAPMERRICLIVDDLGGYIICRDGPNLDPSDPEKDAQPCYGTLSDAQIAAHHDGYTHFRRSNRAIAKPISRECKTSDVRPIPTRLNRT